MAYISRDIGFISSLLLLTTMLLGCEGNFVLNQIVNKEFRSSLHKELGEHENTAKEVAFTVPDEMPKLLKEEIIKSPTILLDDEDASLDSKRGNNGTDSGVGGEVQERSFCFKSASISASTFASLTDYDYYRWRSCYYFIFAPMNEKIQMTCTPPPMTIESCSWGYWDIYLHGDWDTGQRKCGIINEDLTLTSSDDMLFFYIRGRRMSYSCTFTVAKPPTTSTSTTTTTTTPTTTTTTTTKPQTTKPPTTINPTTKSPTTHSPTTPAASTKPPTTNKITTKAATTDSPINDPVNSNTVTTTQPEPVSCGIAVGVRSNPLLRGVTPGTKIVGGTPVKSAEVYPWQARLVHRKSVSTFCGGALISESWVVSATHCMIYSASDIQIYLGDLVLSKNDGEIAANVSSYITHEDYTTNTIQDDIALIQLESPVTLSSTIRPICLPCGYVNKDLTGEYITVAGWGYLNENNGKMSDHLMAVSVPVVTNTYCAGRYGSTYIRSTTLCAGEALGGKDSCQGDSGGPGTWVADGITYLVGVVSFGYGCARPSYPGAYTRVTEYIDWIETETGVDFCT